MNSNTAHKKFNAKLFKRLLQYARPYKGVFIAVAIAAILLSGFAALRPWLLKQTVDLYIVPKDIQGLLEYVLLMGGVLILEVIFQFCFVYFANWLGQSIVRDVRQELFKKMLRFKMKYYNNASVGQLVSRNVKDTERIAEIFSQGFFMIISDFLKMLVVLGVMFYTNWRLSLIVLFVLPVLLYATRRFQKAMKNAFVEVRKQVGELDSFVQERVTGMKIVQLFAREQIEYQKFKQINTKHKNAWIKTVWYNSIFFPIAELASSITIGLVVWYGALQVVGHSYGMQIGTIFMFVQMSQMLFRPLRQIADKFNTLQMGMVAANRVFTIIDTQSSIEDKGTRIAKNLQGDIVFDKVCFGYKPEQQILHQVSFTVPKGQTIAIVGATGAGKSTLINLLNRFYNIDSGQITIDTIAITDFTLSSLRSELGVVLQDVFLFADTIYNNVTLRNPEISLETVQKAAKAIGIHDFIMTLPNNYHYNVKERGGMLSTGQRQLLAFLRVYVSNPSILILDEATSSIDSHSEQLLQKATDTITQGRTAIVIAHRLATIKKADLIMVMDKGRVVEQGTHTQLLQNPDGYYYTLHHSQFAQQLL